MDQNPILIQRHHHRQNFAQKAPPAPLFLIHDGGGTVFSYFLLESLGRTVYGISNPNFETESTWENGIASMAEYYVNLIKATYPSGHILLGGWSLGGLIAIQAAHILSNDPELKVVGIVMIDSTFPVEGQFNKARRLAFMAETSTSPDMKEKTRKCMDEARIQSREWKAPSWRSSATETLDNHSQTINVQIHDHVTPTCPPTVLIRALDDGSNNSRDLNETSPTETSNDSETQALGFDRYQNFNLRYVVNTPGDHFSIFNKENVKELSKKVKEACDKLVMKS
ncbi:alpha/beta-Hydrolase [Glarea lozoyensis ATCC 20868]|uniref:Thioesterase gloN n=1 Tax=Glarea lozoyensis (strain ATCC 20868 / MF5171) TaxID=1116229 RepID=GLON_GLAL2|nr:alpha/beta-Hydrolase [Glarea lozoyensis ATCC 20868]S3E7P4.1 RecName: Full=Probable thioesterase gloN; AltName: Full=Pneumocandin biosynthesis cluster protein N [Glarea lozoyensis ATCC 20868]EPE34338.1 alpha/beta-Hydrolase [Glarea lozoyensis ATCC 20868]